MIVVSLVCHFPKRLLIWLGPSKTFTMSPKLDNSVSNETPSNDQFIHLAITSASNSVENDIGATTKNDDKDSNNGLETNDSTKEKLTRVVDETIDMASPFHNSKFISSRQQPKPKVEEEKLAQKYAQITSISERAYQILVDLGMLEKI